MKFALSLLILVGTIQAQAKSPCQEQIEKVAKLAARTALDKGTPDLADKALKSRITIAVEICDMPIGALEDEETEPDLSLPDIEVVPLGSLK